MQAYGRQNVRPVTVAVKMAVKMAAKKTQKDWLELLDQARVATLATIGSDGRVDLVPCTFAFDDRVLVTAIDHKPKTTPNLKRLENVRKFPEVSLLAHYYKDDDWTKLWWVRVRGRASVHDHGAAWNNALALLKARYEQYEQTAPTGPAIIIDRSEVTGWGASA